MKRRKFLQIGMTGIAVISVGSLVGCGSNGSGTLDSSDGGSASNSGAINAAGDDGVMVVNLSIEEALFEMVDGTLVYMWAYQDRSSVQTQAPRVPGPVITAVTGQDIEIWVTNNLDREHAFAVHGLAETAITIPPGQTRGVAFEAPEAGTYLYLDPDNAPVNRVLGLHGALVILPQSGITPYTTPTKAVQQLFADLGTTPHFPRHAQSPVGWQPERSRIWIMHQIDPRFNQRAHNGETIDPLELQDEFLPRYFTINGKSGVFASHDAATVLSGRIGQPMLVRVINAGLFTHSNHLHANHYYVLAVNNQVQDNVFSLDTFTVFPLDRVDWLVPFIRPPDIPGDPHLPLRTLIPNELGLTISGPHGSPGVRQSPLVYPMHCHNEVSQTAAGGNYPQGAMSHFEFLGDVDGTDFPTVASPGGETIQGDTPEGHRH